MASLEQTSKSRNFYIRFRYQGRNINRSLGTRDRRKAIAKKVRIEETIWLLEEGRIEVPTGVKPIEFILSEGRLTPRATPADPIALTRFFEVYQDRLPAGHKEESTLAGERIHVKHFQRHLGPQRVMQSVTKADLQDYAASRLKDKHHGKLIQPDTVRKELVTFRMLWNWGVEEGLLTGRSPTKDVALPLSDEKPPFMTRGEIERIIRRGSLSNQQAKQYWEAVYLERDEIALVLDAIRKHARYRFIYPMMVFIAHTGARRSEMIRSRYQDIDFSTKSVVIREKKKSRKKALTYRRIDSSPTLLEAMDQWFSRHPGGEYTFAQLTTEGDATPLTRDAAQHHLNITLRRTEWNFINGFHVFRHSFASNLAAAGVDQRVIDEFMGHQTEEMRRRYRHLFPRQRRSAIESVFGAHDPDDSVRLANGHRETSA